MGNSAPLQDKGKAWSVVPKKLERGESVLLEGMMAGRGILMHTAWEYGEMPDTEPDLLPL